MTDDTACWYAFRCFSLPTLYGYGTFDEACLYASRLNGDGCQANPYCGSLVYDDKLISDLTDGVRDDGFDIADRLAMQIVGYVIGDPQGDYPSAPQYDSYREAAKAVALANDLLDEPGTGRYAVGAMLSDGTVTFEI